MPGGPGLTVCERARQLSSCKPTSFAGGMRYSEELERAYWVFHDQRDDLIAIAFHGVSQDQAGIIWEGLHNRLVEGEAIDGGYIAELYGRAVGKQFVFQPPVDT